MNKQQFPSPIHATMCLFGYYIYEDCAHKGVEVVSHCVERLWKAGIDGQLWACVEVQYIRHLMELAPLTWEGRHGYCKHCQRKYAVSLLRPFFKISYLAQIVIYHLYRKVKENSRHQQIPETVSLCSFNDLNVSAERPQPIPPSEDPYIYTPFVTKTVTELLGIENQIPPEEMHDGYKIIFPSNLDIYDRTEAGGNFQWLSQGWFAGKRVGPVVSRFSLRNGMTIKDQGVVAEAILNEKLLGIWRYVVGL